jgi:uncharacterized repeat protein (TIGR01451 family)
MFAPSDARRKTAPHTRRSLAVLAAAGVVLGTGVIGLAGPAAAASSIPTGCAHPSGAATVTCTLSYTGGSQDFAVPAGVHSLALQAWGGHGSGARENSGLPQGPGGRGGLVSSTLGVTPGQKLTVMVAGDGIISGTATPAFGYGAGGLGDIVVLGGSGGGGTAILDASGTPLLVAGGGGGGGIGNTCSGSPHDGGAGGDAGQDGDAGQACGSVHAGAGGAAGGQPTPDGGNGLLGDVDQGQPEGLSGGGGGGGGYLGGTGGNGPTSDQNLSGRTPGGGGGGGANYAAPSLTSVDLSELSDRGLGSNGQVTIAYAAPDTTAPVADPSTDEPVNPAGWTRHSPVTVSWRWEDQGGQIDASSCTTQSVASDEGSTTLAASCADLWGNVGTTSYTVRIDRAAPVDAPTQTQTAAGTSVDWNWSDATSGVDPSQCVQHSTTVKTAGTLTGSCTDLAGNTATVSYAIQDTTAPQAAPVLTPAPNANGWNNTDVTINWNWTDSGSGIDQSSPGSCPQTTPVKASTTGEVTVRTFGTCLDQAGNQGTSDMVSVNIDVLPPVDNPVVTTTATGASVAWNWSEDSDNSGVDPSKCTQSSSQTGTGQLTLTASCTDLAGNTATDSKTVTVTASATKADVQVKVSGPATGRKNTAYAYTVTVKNSGPGVAKNVVATMLLPGRATYVSASGSPLRVGPLLTWTTASLASGSSVSYTVTVKLPSAGSWVLGAGAASLPTRTTSATPDPNLLNNLAAVTTKVS